MNSFLNRKLVIISFALLLCAAAIAFALRPAPEVPQATSASTDAPAAAAEEVQPDIAVQEPQQPVAEEKQIAPVVKDEPKEAPVVAAPKQSAYCASQDDCSGFKVRIEFQEDPACDKPGSADYPCYYKDIFSGDKYLYYLVVRHDKVDGEVVAANPNSGAEQFYEDLLGDYNPATGDISFTYGYYRYPELQLDFRSFTHKGKISGGQFIGKSDIKTQLTGKVTSLPITQADKIPKKSCLIKGDKGPTSGYSPVFYLPSSASYAKVNPFDWFCSEADAEAAGYKKSLQ